MLWIKLDKGRLVNMDHVAAMVYSSSAGLTYIIGSNGSRDEVEGDITELVEKALTEVQDHTGVLDCSSPSQ